MNKSRKFVSAAAAIAIMGSAVSLTAASAAPETGIQVTNRCGSGYGRIDSENLNALGPNYGVVYLFYNGANGYNCVFTEKLVARGVSTYTTAVLCRASDGGCVSDPPTGGNGYYRHYAGPIYLYARSTCVSWGGRVTNTNGTYDAFRSGWEHCGR